MISGQINCICGQVFIFRTIFESIQCPKCHKSYIAEEYKMQENEEVQEEEQYEQLEFPLEG